MILADATQQLRGKSTFALVSGPDGRPLGVGVRFEGFGQPVASVVSDHPDATVQLLDAVGRQGALVCVNVEQHIPVALERCWETIDPWLVAPCRAEADPAEPASAHGYLLGPVEEISEIASFYREHGVDFWCPEMFAFGHCIGVRDPRGRLCCVGSVNHLLPQLRYAHIGALVTAPSVRRQGLAARVLAAMKFSLAAVGVTECGLFADAGSPWLRDMYARSRFAPHGAFRFFRLG